MSYKTPDNERKNHRKWYAAHREEIRAKRNLPEEKERQRERLRIWKDRPEVKKRRAEQARQYRAAHPHYGVIPTREYRHKLRLKVIAHFGGKCVRCGFDDWRALQVDHIYGGGRKEFPNKRPSAIYYHNFLLKVKPGEKHQLLCANCNQIKKHEKKEFPAWYAPGTQDHREYGGNIK